MNFLQKQNEEVKQHLLLFNLKSSILALQTIFKE
jgi:hypothetical protein